MTGDEKFQDRFRKNAPASGISAYLQPKEPDGEDAEVSGGGFAVLRGINDRAATLELRLKDGNSRWFAYSLLGTFQYDRSEGLLLRFSGDLIYLVLIKGSNLDKPSQGGVNLMTGLQRHRVVWIKEMSKEEIKKAGDSGPTIDSIQVSAFESNDELKKWVDENAPAFLR